MSTNKISNRSSNSVRSTSPDSTSDVQGPDAKLKTEQVDQTKKSVTADNANDWGALEDAGDALSTFVGDAVDTAKDVAKAVSDNETVKTIADYMNEAKVKQSDAKAARHERLEPTIDLITSDKVDAEALINNPDGELAYQKTLTDMSTSDRLELCTLLTKDNRQATIDQVKTALASRSDLPEPGMFETRDEMLQEAAEGIVAKLEQHAQGGLANAVGQRAQAALEQTREQVFEPVNESSEARRDTLAAIATADGSNEKTMTRAFKSFGLDEDAAAELAGEMTRLKDEGKLQDFMAGKAGEKQWGMLDSTGEFEDIEAMFQEGLDESMANLDQLHSSAMTSAAGGDHGQNFIFTDDVFESTRQQLLADIKDPGQRAAVEEMLKVAKDDAEGVQSGHKWARVAVDVGVAISTAGLGAGAGMITGGAIAAGTAAPGMAEGLIGAQGDYNRSRAAAIGSDQTAHDSQVDALIDQKGLTSAEETRKFKQRYTVAMAVLGTALSTRGSAKEVSQFADDTGKLGATADDVVSAQNIERGVETTLTGRAQRGLKETVEDGYGAAIDGARDIGVDDAYKEYQDSKD